MAKRRTMAGKRIRLLIHHVAERIYGAPIDTHGMQVKVARHTGMRPDTINQLLKDTKDAIDPETIAKIYERMRLKSTFFTDRKQGDQNWEPNFEDYIDRGRKGPAATQPREAEEPLDEAERAELLQMLNADADEQDVVGELVKKSPLPLTASAVEAAVKALRIRRRRDAAYAAAINIAADNEMRRTSSRPLPPAPEPEDGPPTQRPSKPARRRR